MHRTLRWLAIAAVALVLPSSASAQFTFVGSWSVGDGPFWMTNPQVMSGVETAAFLFGGSASDYVISTKGSDAALIDYMTFVDGWGDPQYLLSPAAQDFKATTNPDGGYDCRAYGCSYSAYVNDHSLGGQYVNYAFRVEAITTTPEPASIALVATGLVASTRNA